MVYNREALAKPPRLSFSCAELEAILTAAKSDRDVKKATLEKLAILKDFARTKDAYRMGSTTITVS